MVGIPTRIETMIGIPRTLTRRYCFAGYGRFCRTGMPDRGAKEMERIVSPNITAFAIPSTAENAKNIDTN